MIRLGTSSYIIEDTLIGNARTARWSMTSSLCCLKPRVFKYSDIDEIINCTTASNTNLHIRFICRWMPVPAQRINGARLFGRSAAEH